MFHKHCISLTGRKKGLRGNFSRNCGPQHLLLLLLDITSECVIFSHKRASDFEFKTKITSSKLKFYLQLKTVSNFPTYA